MRQWVQITAGRGPIECAWVVPRVLQCFVAEAARHDLAVEVLSSLSGPLPGTLSSVLLAIDGAAPASFLNRWRGTIQWIGHSPFRAHEKRKNWFVGVEWMMEPEKPRWSPADVSIESMRASGPGGQHVNKTECAVRITHGPTGLSVTAREERSQLANRKLAFARLAQLFTDRAHAGARKAQQQLWSQHDRLMRGNPVRIFQGPSFEPKE